MQKNSPLRKECLLGIFSFLILNRKMEEARKDRSEVPKRGHYEDNMKAKNLSIKKIMTLGK